MLRSWLRSLWQCQGRTRHWPAGHYQELERAKQLPGALPGSSTRARAHRARSWSQTPSSQRLPKSPRGGPCSVATADPRLASLWRQIGLSEAGRRRKGKSGASPRPSILVRPFILLLLSRARVKNSSRSPQPALVSLRSPGPTPKLPRGGRPWAGPVAPPRAPHSAARLGTRKPFGPGERAAAPTGNPVPADFIRTVAEDGMAGGRVCLPKGT